MNILRKEQNSKEHHLVYGYENYQGELFKRDRASVRKELKNNFYSGYEHGKLGRRKFVVPNANLEGNDVTIHMINIDVTDFYSYCNSLKGNIYKLDVTNKKREGYAGYEVIKIIESIVGSFKYYYVHNSRGKITIKEESESILNERRILGRDNCWLTKSEAKKKALQYIDDTIEKEKQAIRTTDERIKRLKRDISVEELEKERYSNKIEDLKKQKSNFISLKDVIKKHKKGSE